MTDSEENNSVPEHPARRHKWLMILGSVLFLTIGSFAALNYFGVEYGLSSALASDPRNSEVSANGHYAYYVNPTVAVFDLTSAKNASCLDVMRVLFQFADKERTSSYDQVDLAQNGHTKFVLPGAYFRSLGGQYHRGQNPVYLITTLPQNIEGIDGAPAFVQWSGGWLGVLSHQMKDVASFCNQFVGPLQ